MLTLAKRLLALILTLDLASLCQAEVPPLGRDVDFRVKLTSSLSSRENKKGDKISAIVLSPDAFKGATLEGTVEEAKSSGKVNKSSTLRFSFHSLVLPGNEQVAVQTHVKSYKNSKGKEGVDEEGNIVEKSGNLGKVGIGTAAGAGIGALIGGGKGAAIGAGVGAAATVLVVAVGVKGPNVHFAAGSE